MAATRNIFVTLAVEDLDRSVAFFTKLGFTFDSRFTDEKATCMTVSDEAFVMLLTRPAFAHFTTRALDDPRMHTEGSSRSQPRAEGRRARRHGARRGRLVRERADGDKLHVRAQLPRPGRALWEVFWMDPTAIGQGAATATA